MVDGEAAGAKVTPGAAPPVDVAGEEAAKIPWLLLPMVTDGRTTGVEAEFEAAAELKGLLNDAIAVALGEGVEAEAGVDEDGWAVWTPVRRPVGWVRKPDCAPIVAGWAAKVGADGPARSWVVKKGLLDGCIDGPPSDAAGAVQAAGD